jgi:hypothetical protein
MITVNALKCPKCLSVIYSRAQYDFRRCTCGACFVDGGFEYMRFGYDPDIKMNEPFRLEVDSSQDGLFQDWNKREDKFGLIIAKD